MKKFFAIPLIVLYLVAVSGMMVQLHFCGSKLSSWEVNKPKASCCCESGAQKKEATTASLSKKAMDCCQDKTITLKIAQDQNTASHMQLQLQSVQVAMLPLPMSVYVSSGIPAKPLTPAYQANAPPGRWQNIPLYKLHSRFTYYG
jgi:hypothetical protein